jgi:glyoxylase-like metal-dependent hydrolase (beta-lactamase superfamily II)
MEERIMFKPPWIPVLEQVADGVWVVRGDVKNGMNVYLLRDGSGVTAFDAGTKAMVKPVQKAAEQLGGLRRVVLGHADADHRGIAPYMGVPVICHPDEVAAAESDEFRDYWDLSKIEVGYARRVYPFLLSRWDGGAVQISETITEGDELCGFRVYNFPGHAPGQIGLFRESDGLAIVSDTVYFVDSSRFKPIDHPSVPHDCFNWDTQKAAESVRKLAALDPKKVAAGHAEPFEAPDLVEQLLKAADAVDGKGISPAV